MSVRELCSIVHEEVAKLPSKYRLPIVLCYLEGKTHEETAQGAELAQRNRRRAAGQGSRSLASTARTSRHHRPRGRRDVFVMGRLGAAALSSAVVRATVSNAIAYAWRRPPPFLHR